MSKKKSIEFNFVTFIIILVILLGIVFVVARGTGHVENNPKIEESKIEEEPQQEKESKLYSNNVITIDEGKMADNWEIVEDTYGSIAFYIQGPKNDNEDGTVNDIRINVYIQASQMTNDELKRQMLEDSIYSKIEYNKMQEINKLQWMEFEAENKGVKAKILTIMKEGYMYALEITGEEEMYNKHYNEAMRVVMTTQIAERIPQETAEKVIYQYDNLTNIKEGGTQFLLTSLNLPKTIEKTEENSNLPEEYKDYIWTGIKYEDFFNEMTKYTTEENLKIKFSEFVEYEKVLLVKDVTGEQVEYMIEKIEPIQVKGTETTYQVTKIRMNTFETVKEKITLKYENDKCVVSNYEK